MMRISRCVGVVYATLVGCCALVQPLRAQGVAGRQLTLEQALRAAEDASEQVAIARAGVMRARGELKRARSEYFPQIFASLGYTRTLRSEFQGLTGSRDTTAGGPAEPCGSFTPNPALPLETRVDSLEAAVRCASTTDPFAAFSDLPFGREHQYNVGFSLSQTVFSGGRVQAQSRIAEAGRSAAEIALDAERAVLALDVTQAYYGAALSDQLFTIAEATLAQADTTLRHVRVGREVGEQPEFELLRAQVTFENQRPVVIQRAADRTLAYMRLKQLLNLPLDAPVELTTVAEEAELTPIVALVGEVLDLPLDTALAARAPVRQAEEAVQVQEGLVSVARAQRIPTLSLSSQYDRVAYPANGIPDHWGDFRTNWTISASVQVPVFTGGRISGDEMVARADLEQSRRRLDETRELATLDTRDAFERLRAAEASWQASAGTVDQAVRAYRIAEVRFEEGISTQLELTDARILLQQAQANRAVAARDLQVARVRAALLRYLPISVGGAAGMGTGGVVQPQQPQQVAPQPVAPQRALPVSTTGTGVTGSTRRMTGGSGGPGG
jgi:outer membrane protein TolC